MLNRNYVVAFNMGSFSHFSDDYSEGFKGSISYVIFKINSIYANSDLTISANALPNAKVNAEVVLIDRTMEMSTSNIKGLSNSSALKKTDTELRNSLQYLLLQMVWNKAGRKVADFQPLTTLLAKREMALGTKENIKIDNRFFVYENVQNRKGEVVKKKRGTMRVKKVGNNKGKATGESEKSKLYKIGYGKAKEGMLVQQKEDVGVGISLGYGDFSWIRIDVRFKGTWPGALFFLDIHPFPGKVEFKDGYTLYNPVGEDFDAGDISTFGINIYAGFERQVRLGSALYLSPFLGFGYSTFTILSDLGEDDGFGLFSWDDDNDEIYSSWLATGGARLGLQLSSSLSVNFTLGYLLPVIGSWKDPSYSLGGTGEMYKTHLVGGDDEVTDKGDLERFYNEELKDIPAIPDGIQTTIMLRYEF
jgi:hypothetical protein